MHARALGNASVAAAAVVLSAACGTGGAGSGDPAAPEPTPTPSAPPSADCPPDGETLRRIADCPAPGADPDLLWRIATTSAGIDAGRHTHVVAPCLTPLSTPLGTQLGGVR